jgi:hypothetical protein
VPKVWPFHHVKSLSRNIFIGPRQFGGKLATLMPSERQIVQFKSGCGVGHQGAEAGGDGLSRISRNPFIPRTVPTCQRHAAHNQCEARERLSIERVRLCPANGADNDQS